VIKIKSRSRKRCEEVNEAPGFGLSVRWTGAGGVKVFVCAKIAVLGSNVSTFLDAER